ncbi:MAG: response regulator [Deltaproteobacteria bacterium]|nr:response regulator [Deltaproteobacteria bacterium]
MMTDKILFVDDDSSILAAYERQLRKKFLVQTALGAQQGLAAVSNRGPYAVIVSDLRMPGMDGIQFLSHARQVAPDSVRMILTGYADIRNAIEAVNEGNVFRFLTKPCDPNTLAKALAAGIEQYRLVTAERELLEKTLRGSIRVLTEILGLLNPEAFGRAQRITRYAKEIALEMGISKVWQLETAAMLSQIGWIILPEDLLKKIYKGQALTKEETRLFNTHPSIASDLLAHIPRMQGVAKIIAYQEKRFDGSGLPRDARRGKDIPLGSRILKVVLDFDALEASGTQGTKALAVLKERSGWYDPGILAALEAVLELDQAKYELRDVSVRELGENMILAEHVRTANGLLLVTKGNQISRPMLQRLRNFASTSGIKEPIRVLIPLTGRIHTHHLEDRPEGGIRYDTEGPLRR